MIRGELINAAIGAVYEKTGQLLQTTKDRAMQRQMMDEAAALVADFIPSCPETDSEDSPRA